LEHRLIGQFGQFYKRAIVPLVTRVVRFINKNVILGLFSSSLTRSESPEMQLESSLIAHDENMMSSLCQIFISIGGRINVLANDELRGEFVYETLILQTNWRHRADFCEEARDQAGGRWQTVALRMSHHSRSYAKDYMVSQWKHGQGFAKA